MKIQIDDNVFIQDDYGTSVALVEVKTFTTGKTKDHILGYYPDVASAMKRYGIEKINRQDIDNLNDYLVAIRAEFDRLSNLLTVKFPDKG